MHAHGKMLNKLMKKVEAEYVTKQYKQRVRVCVCVCVCVCVFVLTISNVWGFMHQAVYNVFLLKRFGEQGFRGKNNTFLWREE